MLKIGDFSRLSRVSIRMLRYYDDNDLIKPEKIDAVTGYRFYSASQLVRMGRINALKDMGFGVSAIREILKEENNPENLERIFAVHKSQLAEEEERLRNRIQLLDTALERLRKDEIMNYNCIVKQMPERYVASVRMIIPQYEEEGMLWHYLMKETKAKNVAFCGAAIALLHDKEYKETDVDVEVQMEVKGTYDNTEHVIFKTEPEILVASTTFNGSYSQFSDVYASLAAWVTENGYEFSGPMMNMHHVSPHETKNPDEYVTEVCCPVKKK